MKPHVAWFAYDEPDDLEPLISAAQTLSKNGLLKNNVFCCYVLIGYGKDTIDSAEERLVKTAKMGFFPQAMLFNNGEKIKDREYWKRFAREWSNKIIVGSKVKQIRKETL